MLYSAASLRFQLADSPSGQTELHQTLLLLQSLHRINAQNALADERHIWAGRVIRLVILCIEESIRSETFGAYPNLSYVVICQHFRRNHPAICSKGLFSQIATG